MDKILLEITCPSTSQTYEFWVSQKMVIGKAKKKIIDEIRSYENNQLYSLNEDNVFLLKEDASVVSDAFTFEQENVTSGQRLVLI